MKDSNYKILNANQAVADIAYKTNEVFPIYPITPSSEMSELVEQWSAEKRPNRFDNIPSVFQMQSEAGVAGAMHGALQTGSLSSTFTASQGLLLMLPNMYKIAGELTPNVIHVATRSIATHALSIFGDHSDVMAIRQSGYAMLSSASVQEAHDFALISQASTLKSRIPFVHFFDGFRTSHELNKIELIPNEVINKLIDNADIENHKNRALNPKNPVLRGTTQGPDVFFQSREATNTFYNECPNIVQKKMDEFAKLTGRQYNLFDFVGHSKAEHIIIAMASSTETIEDTIDYLNSKGERYGLIKVRLFRPFSTKHLIYALPKTVKKIVVLDRTKESGSTGEPLYLDVLQTITEAFQTNKMLNLPRIVGGRYGLSSKEFTPAMVLAIFKNLKLQNPKNNFTVGINDDITNLSLDYSEELTLNNFDFETILYHNKSQNTLESLNKFKQHINDKNYIQAYTECSYKKSNTNIATHIRISKKPIKAPYLIGRYDAEKAVLPIEKNNDFAETIIGKLLKNKGNEIPVSMLPVDGTYSTNTSLYNSKQRSEYVPEWNDYDCTQCGACSMACPQAALRIKVFDNELLETAPTNFKHAASKDFDLLHYTIQINQDQCNSCNNCIDACPVSALNMINKDNTIDHWNYFERIPEIDRKKIDVTKISQQQLQEPLFKYSDGVEGCGESPYLKLISQLYGERLLIANATGASSIFGGALPTTPWSKTKLGKGPAWSNSLFEDNAEFGLGYRLSLDFQEEQAKKMLLELKSKIDYNLVYSILNAQQNDETEIQEQTDRVNQLKNELKNINSKKAKQLYNIADSLVKKSVWIVGGDGWAYDIGFGGLDHVLTSGKNVNILVLDNEVYDNTGGQASKSTPFGAEAKFSFNGKQKQKKDLGKFAMLYDNVYVASVAIGANQEQTLKAFNDAGNFNGPSIIIAYCHSESHGIDMKNPSKYHKAAVKSGQWLLYRNDPRRIEKKLTAMKLDSSYPTIAIEDYLKLEQRFSKLFKEDKKQIDFKMKKLQNQVNSRYNKYNSMAELF